LLVVSAAVANSESKPTSSEIALSEYLVDYTPVVSASDESVSLKIHFTYVRLWFQFYSLLFACHFQSDEDDGDSDEEKTYYRKPAVANYVRMYNEPKYLITYSPPIVPTVQVAPTAAPAYKAPVPSYDRPTVLPYWLRPRT